MSMFDRGLSRLARLFALIVAMAWAIPAFAQTTGALQGTVTGPDDNPVSGATITISSPNLIGGAQTKASGADGAFKFTNLTPGIYELLSTMDGLQDYRATNIQITINRTTTVDIKMSEEDVIVVDAPDRVVQVDNVTRGEVLTREFLQRIPSGRSYQSAVQLATGVTGGSNPNMGGQAYNENTYMLDGATITDPVTGTFSLNFNYDAIEQVEVLLGGYEPEYNTIGGIVNIVTQSGTNNLEFDTSVFYTNGNIRPREDARYTADGLQLAPTGFDASSQRWQAAAQISGPVVRDRAWFIFSYQHSRTLFQNVGIPIPWDFDGHYVLGKLTVQPNAEHRLTLNFQTNPTTIDNLKQSDLFVKAEAQSRQSQGGAVGQARWQWFLSPDASLDTMITLQSQYLEGSGVPCTHNRKLGYNPCKPDEREDTTDWTTPGRIGLYGAYDSVNHYSFDLDDRARYQASSKLSLVQVQDPLGGKHDIKLGIEGSQLIWDRTLGYFGNTYYYDLDKVPYDPSTFMNYYWIESSGPVKYRNTGSQWNWFAQDAWKPVNNLTIKYGTRWDSSVLRNDLGTAVVNSQTFGPRVYAAWDPFGDQKTKIGGGWGRYNDTSRLAVAAFTSKSSFGYKLFLGEFFDGNNRGFLNSQAQMYDISPKENPTISADNIRVPRVDDFILLLQRELVEDVAIGANLTARYTRNVFVYDQTNLIFDEDGSAIIGARDGDTLVGQFRLRTPTQAKRDYYQGDIYLDKRDSRRWAGRITYTYQEAFGNAPESLTGSFANDPQLQYAYGRTLTNINHQVKGYAYWQLPTDPWVQTLGVFFTYLSGQPLERFYYSDFGYSLRIRPRGEYTRYPPNWAMSIKFSQDLDVRKGKLVLDFEARNLFNNRAPDNFSGLFYSQNRLLITSRQDPLTMQFGLRYTF